MSNYSDPIFGPLDNESSGLWTTKLAYGSRELQADLNIDGDIDVKQLTKVTEKLADLAALEAKARTAMVADCAKKKSSVAQYRTVDTGISEDALEQENPAPKEDIATFLQRCEFKRIALYPECPSHCLILDFALQDASTDHMLVISMNSQGEVVGVDLQS